MSPDYINQDQQFRGFNAGCIDPQAHMSDLLAGKSKYGVNKSLPASIPVANTSIQELGIAKLSDSVESVIRKVFPVLGEVNSRTMSPQVIILDALGAGTLLISAFRFRFFAWYLTYQISALAGVLSTLLLTRNGVDGSLTPAAQNSISWQANLNCLNSTQGGQALFFERRIPKNQSGGAVSCNDQNIGVCKSGEDSGSPLAPQVENIVFAGSPGAVLTTEFIGDFSKSVQEAKEGTIDVFAQATYRKIASLMANDMKVRNGA